VAAVSALLALSFDLLSPLDISHSLVSGLLQTKVKTAPAIHHLLSSRAMETEQRLIGTRARLEAALESLERVARGQNDLNRAHERHPYSLRSMRKLQNDLYDSRTRIEI
jgi:hypothetical protein